MTSTTVVRTGPSPWTRRAAAAIALALVFAGGAVAGRASDGSPAPRVVAEARRCDAAGTTELTVAVRADDRHDVQLDVDLRGPHQPGLIPVTSHEPSIGRRVGHQTYRPTSGLLVLTVPVGAARDTVTVRATGPGLDETVEVETTPRCPGAIP